MNLKVLYSKIKNYRFDSYLSIFDTDVAQDGILNSINIDVYSISNFKKIRDIASNSFQFSEANMKGDFRLYFMASDASFDYYSFFDYKFTLHDITLEDLSSFRGQAKFDLHEDYGCVNGFCPAREDEVFGGRASVLLFENFALFMLPSSVLENVSEFIEMLERADEEIREDKKILYTIFLDYLSQGYYFRLNSLNDRVSNLEENIFRESRIFEEIKSFREATVFYRNKANNLSKVIKSIYQEYKKLDDEMEKRLDAIQSSLNYATEEFAVLKGTSGDLLNLYLAFNSKKTNDVMSLLTLVTSVFIPLSFITGLYGMNFDSSSSAYNMPELKWKYGYFYVLALLVTIALLMISIFIYRGWLSVKKEGNV